MQTKRFTRSLVAVAVAVAVSAGFVAGRHDGGAPLMGSAYAAGAVPELSGDEMLAFVMAGIYIAFGRGA